MLSKWIVLELVNKSFSLLLAVWMCFLFYLSLNRTAFPIFVLPFSKYLFFPSGWGESLRTMTCLFVNKLKKVFVRLKQFLPERTIKSNKADSYCMGSFVGLWQILLPVVKECLKFKWPHWWNGCFLEGKYQASVETSWMIHPITKYEVITKYCLEIVL